MEVHCPQCQGKIILDGEPSPDGFRCGECGSTFVRADHAEKTVSFVPEGAEYAVTFVPGGRQMIAEELPALGGYEVIEENARAGMGVVYRARQRTV